MPSDISQENRNLFNFEEMICRALKYEKEKGQPPQVVYVDQNQKEYVNLSRFREMCIRYFDFVRKNNRIPRFITVNPTVSKPANNCCSTGFYQQDLQDTGYSCGASSMKMALSAYRIFVTEQEIMRIAGTTTSGTTHDGMIRAANHYGLRAYFKNFTDAGWGQICNHIQKGGEIILHIMTDKLQTDCNGNTVWRGAYGHYIYLTSVCPDKKQVTVADPTKGVRCHTFSQMEAAMRAVYWAPSVLFLEKPARADEPTITAVPDKGPNGIAGEQGITTNVIRDYADAIGASANQKLLLGEIASKGRIKAPTSGLDGLDVIKIDNMIFLDPEAVIARVEDKKIRGG